MTSLNSRKRILSKNISLYRVRAIFRSAIVRIFVVFAVQFSLSVALITPTVASQTQAEVARGEERTSPSGDSQKSQLPEIEKKIWLSSHAELSKLEYEVTHLVQEQPYSAYAHYLLASLYLRLFETQPGDIRKFRIASQLSEQTLRLDQNSEYGYLVTARVMDIMGFTDKAIDLVDPRKNKMIGESWRSLFYRAQLSSGKASYTEFSEMVSGALERSPQSADLVVPLLISFLQVHNEPNEIVVHLEEWNKRFKHPAIKKGLALAYTDTAQHKKADKVYSQVVAGESGDLEAIINRSIIQHQQLGNTVKAISSLEKVRLQIDKLDQYQRNIALSHLGDMYLERGNFKKAQDLFVKVVKESQNYQSWITFCKDAYTRRDKHKEFSSFLDVVKEEVPGISLVYAMQGEVLSNELGDQESAIRSFSDAILLDPTRSTYYTGVGLAYYRQSEILKALGFFRKATNLDPQDAIARYNEACMLAMLGRTQEALGSLKEALTLNPKLAKTAISDDDFKNLREVKQFQMLTDNRNWGSAISTTSSTVP